MKRQHADAQVMPYPRIRRFASAAARVVRHKPLMHGLLEVDVTRPRRVLRDYKARTGETLSFTAFLATCLAKAVDEDKAVHAYRQGRKRLVLFEDVDISTPIERDAAGRKSVVPYIIRAANRKTFHQMHEEIRAAQRAGIPRVLTRLQSLSLELFSSLPGVLHAPFFWSFAAVGRWRPRLLKESAGTVGLTSVGMFGAGAGWGVSPATPMALLVTVGGIGERRTMVDGYANMQEYLSLTISFDHEIVDEAPAARFIRRLKELIESGYGLTEITVALGQAVAEGATKQEVEAACADVAP